MTLFKYLLINATYIIFTFIFYYFLGFELTVITALAIIMSSIDRQEITKSPKNIKQVYIKPRTNMRF
jgi:hypothetical protein